MKDHKTTDKDLESRGAAGVPRESAPAGSTASGNELASARKAISEATAFLRSVEWSDSASEDRACDVRQELEAAESALYGVEQPQKAER